MSPASKVSITFGISAVVSSIPIVWFFAGFFPAVLWFGMPLFASAVSIIVAHTMQRCFGIGAISGAAISLLSLCICVIFVGLGAFDNGYFEFTTILLAGALLWLGWYIAIVGSLTGWLSQRYILHP